MNLGEIKVEALKLMYVDYVDDLGVENLESMKADANFAGIMSAMPGAINRCFARIEDLDILPLKSIAVQKSQCVQTENGLRLELDKIVEDFGYIDRVICEDETGYNGNHDYIMETDTTIFLPNKEKFIIVYAPTLPRVLGGTDENIQIPIPNKIACLIPYFIKGDLFREDEPAEAAEARNIFESSVEAMKTKKSQRQSRIKVLFSMEG